MRRSVCLLALVVTGCAAPAAQRRPQGDASAPDRGGAQLLPPAVGAGRLVTDVFKEPYRPTLPPDLDEPGTVAWGVFKICVSSEGGVTDARPIKSASPSVDRLWVAKIRTWRYRPLTVNGRPVPYCYPMRLEVRAK
jgi:hypothetical protein